MTMIRFLMVKKEKLLSGGEKETYYTIEDSVKLLETALSAGGSSESEYEIHQLIGVEVI